MTPDGEIRRRAASFSLGFGEQDLTDVLFDVVAEDESVCQINDRQMDLLGLEYHSAARKIGSIYVPESCLKLRELLARPVTEGFEATLELALIGRGGQEIRTIARCSCVRVGALRGFAVSKILLGALADSLDDLKNDNLVLRKIIDEAREGHWCIEFLEPIDVNRPDHEVVDQIFENASIWRVTNMAMARIYNLPMGQRIGAHDVRLHWPRNPENERFVEEIVASGYFIDNAVSSDLRHDGTVIHCQNDVRADIENGYIKRIWGNCRDVTAMQAQADRSKAQIATLRNVIDGIHDPIVVFYPGAVQIISNNLGFRRMFPEGSPAAALLGRQVRRWSNTDRRKVVSLPVASGQQVRFQCLVSSIEGLGGRPWWVITLKKVRAPLSQARRS